MAVEFPAALIRYLRLERNWSQEGLCRGLCAVSYLSKIEQGKAEPGDELLSALMERLGAVWRGGETAQWAGALAEQLEEALLSMNSARQDELLEQLEGRREDWLFGPHMLNVLLLERLCFGQETPEPVPLKAFEGCFDARERALWLMGEQRAEEALALLPLAYTYLKAGGEAYQHGRYTQAAERLLTCVSRAADEGRARVMLHGRVLLGNCYSDLNDFDGMTQHYRAAERLARDLGETEMLENIYYNTAATDMQLGRFDRAAAVLQARRENALFLHKLAICYEKLGERDKALQALERARTAPEDYPGREWINRMLDLVEYRLLHANFARDPSYGALLTDTYTSMQRELPNGYVLFHLPWMEEWYIANRQYKQAYELARKG